MDMVLDDNPFDRNGRGFETTPCVTIFKILLESAIDYKTWKRASLSTMRDTCDGP